MLIHNFRPGPVGGAEIQAERLARGLVSRGHPIHILTNPVPETDPSKDPGSKLPDAPEEEVFYGTTAESGSLISEDPRLPNQKEDACVGVIHRPPFYLTYDMTTGVAPTFRYLIQNRNLYDILHCHMAFGQAVVAVVAAQRLRRPCIVKIACAGELGELSVMSKFPGYERALHILHQADTMIAVSSEVEKDLLAYGFSPERILRIPNGVDTVFFQPVTRPGHAEKMRFLLVGRRQPQKGVDLLLRAAKILEETGLKGQFEVQLCGSDSPEYDYQEMAVKLGVDHLMNFMPFQQDMRDIFRAAQCFVLPSRGEGLSNALLEAMAVGLPVVATQVSGMSDVITNEEDGLLIPAESAESLAEAMKRIISNADLRQQLGQNARRRVETAFSLEHIVSEYSNLYCRLHGASERGAPL
jgi:glycosyltransferase involved in cell wall biosynthesis